jgi:lysophospholipase L1-like esterase
MGELKSRKIEAADESTSSPPLKRQPRSRTFSATAAAGLSLLLFSILALLVLTPATVPDSLRKTPNNVKSLDNLAEVKIVDALDLLGTHEVTTTESLCRETIPRCSCPNASVPESRGDEHIQLQIFHDTLVHRAHQSAANATLAMLGDSILEYLTGTFMGTNLNGEMHAIYNQYFDQTTTVTLATAGDRTHTLLWHLINGMFPDSLRPKVWFILIGTNNFGIGCSKEAILAGIVYIVNYVRNRRPTSQIILHGLLPRADNLRTYELGEYWVDIQWINQQLRRECEQHAAWCTYMEAPLLFLKQGGKELDPEMMLDKTHPTKVSYEPWSKLVMEVVTSVMNKKS